MKAVKNRSCLKFASQTEIRFEININNTYFSMCQNWLWRLSVFYDVQPWEPKRLIQNELFKLWDYRFLFFCKKPSRMIVSMMFRSTFVHLVYPRSLSGPGLSSMSSVSSRNVVSTLFPNTFVHFVHLGSWSGPRLSLSPLHKNPIQNYRSNTVSCDPRPFRVPRVIIRPWA